VSTAEGKLVSAKVLTRPKILSQSLREAIEVQRRLVAGGAQARQAIRQESSDLVLGRDSRLEQLALPLELESLPQIRIAAKAPLDGDAHAAHRFVELHLLVREVALEAAK